MSEPLVVHLNRRGVHEVELATDTHEVTGDFGVALRNHGQAVHVHLKPEGPLSRVVEVGEPNPFVGTETTATVPVRVADGAAPVEGQLAVVAGYGDERESVTVSVREDGEAPPDPEALAAEDDDGSGGDGDAPADGPMTVRLAAFFGVAVLLAAVAVLLAPSPGVGLAAAAVLAVAVVAVALVVG